MAHLLNGVTRLQSSSLTLINYSRSYTLEVYSERPRPQASQMCIVRPLVYGIGQSTDPSTNSLGGPSQPARPYGRSVCNLKSPFGAACLGLEGCLVLNTQRNFIFGLLR